MVEQASISLYRVKSCGFYKRGERDVAQFGGVGALLEELQLWGGNKELAKTKTFDASEHSCLPAYLVDVHRQGTNWLLSLWNEIESVDGAVASIDGAAVVGNADATLTELDDGAIPGFATYFWFLTDINLIATVRVGQRTAGHYQMNRYLQGFLERFSSHVVLSDDLDENGETYILGYRDNAAGKITRYRPRFRSEVLTKAGEIGWLRERVHLINRVTRHGLLTLADRLDRQLWERVLDSLSLTKPVARPIEVKMNFDLEVNGLDEENFDKIVEEWIAEDNDLNRYGFKLTGDSATYWLDRQYVRDEIMIDVARKPGGIIEPEGLLAGLVAYRRILNGLIGG